MQQGLEHYSTRPQEERESSGAGRMDEVRLMLLAITHEVRSPLQNILGYGELAEYRAKEMRDSTLAAYLANIQDASERMNTLFRSLLDLYSNIQGEIRRDLVDLGLVACEILDEFRRESPERECSLSIGLGLFACCNRELIRILLRNLLSNAWKYTVDQPITRIELSQVPARDGNYFCLLDNGCGFASKEAAAIFLPFRSAHPKLTEAGLGLGLTLAKLIVQSHGGEIRAESTPGDGARFIFRLEPVM